MSVDGTEFGKKFLSCNPLGFETGWKESNSFFLNYFCSVFSTKDTFKLWKTQMGTKHSGKKESAFHRIL
ncbi:hypothetical protein A0128_21055 [Leptospira tipperaryensis]|uniref:Uncharacterized protein n=1 Tax=Leptospira tipperaryensis TaxID=2564040 RepID=A0A1D7V3U5_9LEPT|nr:hypothetical protein A0128_21055 [Leptospira tipperaryensis]